jgi:Secretion system C-terminal sorting domain
MLKQLFIFVLLIISFSFSNYPQNASDYFPSTPGYKWFYKTIPYDSLNREIDSLSFVSIDSFTVNQIYADKPAKVQLNKMGTKETILKSSYLDTNYISLESTNIWNYISSIPGIDTLGIGFLKSLKGWYSVYRLSQTINSSYTIYTKDTIVNYSGVNTTITEAVNAKRLADQTAHTAIGNFLCKKFVLTSSIKAKVSFFTFSIVTINDTVYLAPGNYIVSDIRPSANVDLSTFGQGAFFVPGHRMDILAPPAVLNVNHENISIKYSAGDSLFTVFNSGSDTLHWKSKVIAGTSWLHLTDSLGMGDATVRFSFTKNTNNSLRIGLISVEDTAAWGSPQIITITQEQNITSTEGKNEIPLHFTLFQNYPNPFNPSTSIKYILPFESNVKIYVYNTIGQVVKELVSELQQSGIHELSLLSSSLSSGVYFYTINANSVDGKQNYTNTKKMILLK